MTSSGRVDSRLSLFCSFLQTFVLDRRFMLERRDYEAVEAAESQIDAFILKRSRSQEVANREEEAWKESTRRHNERRHLENRDSWAEHYRQLALCHHDLAAENAARADALAGEGAA